MISRNEYLYTKSKAQNLTLYIAQFEANSPMYQMYKKWFTMPQEEKDKLIQAWDEYYGDCHNGYYGLMFELQKEAYRINDRKMMRMLSKQAQESKCAEHRTPSTVDPRDFPMKMTDYFTAVKRQRELQAIVDEYSNVFETKRGGDTL